MSVASPWPPMVFNPWMKLIFSGSVILIPLEFGGLEVVVSGPQVYPSGVKETSGLVGRKQARI